jgi:putative peptidoglycan lipid II flippase
MTEANNLAKQIGRAGAIIMILSLVDKFLAVGKEMLTAHRFGISASLDVFNLAYSFPGTIILLFSGALTSAFVPLYLEWRKRSDREADSRATWLIYITILFFSTVSLMGYIFTPEIIRVIGYGFPPAERDMAVIMERRLVLLIAIDGAGIVFLGILHARKLFFHLYVAPIFINISIIFLLFLDMGLGVDVLVWGFLIGTALKTIYMVIALHREKFLFGTPLPFDRQNMKVFWQLVIPLLGSQLIANSNLFVDHVMAAELSAGSVSTLRYAFRINDLPIQIVIIAISRAIFPFISEEAAAGNQENLRNIFKYTVILLGFITIPITCLMILFSEDLVILLLKRGAFDLEAARQTAQTLVCYSLGLFFYAYTFVNGTFFAAIQNAKMLLYMGIISIFLNVLFNMLFMHFFGVKGIAMSTSATMGIISICFFIILNRHFGSNGLSRISSNFSRIIMAAAGMMGTGLLTISIFEVMAISRWVFAPIAAVVAISAYLGIIWLFRTPDLDICITVLIDTLTARKKAAFRPRSIS